MASLVPVSLSAAGGGYYFARSLPVVKPLSFFGVGLVDLPLNVSIRNRCVKQIISTMACMYDKSPVFM